ncbi:MAG: hypothetical protein J6C51_04005 [Clostridia bacterium]|nr:hypothetical protein [Clostridia bacterium]
MKKIKVIVSALLVCLLILTGCTGPACTSEYAPAAPTAEPTAEPTPEIPTVTYTLRVIYVYDGGSMMLADQNSGDIYHNRLPDGKTYPAGTLLSVTASDYVLAIWPSQISEIYTAEPIEDGFDDRCALYLDVFEKLWSEDTALQHDIDYIGVDLSETSLTESEQLAVAWCFGGLKGKEALTGTFEELCDEGFIDRENLYWENGCLLSIHENGFLTDEEEDPDKVTFRAQKWRSGLGAIMYTDCTAERDKTGHWGEFTPGGFAIA